MNRNQHDRTSHFTTASRFRSFDRGAWAKQNIRIRPNNALAASAHASVVYPASNVTTSANPTGQNFLYTSGDNGGYQGWKEFAAYSPSAVPEPSTYGLIGAGALASAAVLRRRKR